MNRIQHEAVFGDNVMDNPYKPRNLPDDHAEIAKHAAHHAVAVPNKVTEMK